MSRNTSRRRFLQTAPLAAVALPVSGHALLAESTPAEPVKLTPASEVETALKGLEQKPGNFNLFDAPSLPFLAVLTVEKNKAAKEFEWHEGRDHLLHVVDGSTVYEVGGTPEGGHRIKVGEWLAPASTGCSRMTLEKGDWLLIPRNTPHKRTTADSVSFVLISPTGSSNNAVSQ